MKAAANRTRAATEMAVSHQPPMANVRSIFLTGSQSSLSEVRWHFGRQTLPGTTSLARSGHVFCPDKKHPASARALKVRLPRSRLPWQRRSRPRSRSLPYDGAVWLSYAVSGGAALSSWLYDKLFLVGTLVLKYVHHFPLLTCNHMTIPGLYSTPPLMHSLRPYFTPTHGPLRPAILWPWGRLETWQGPPSTFSLSLTRSAHQFAAQRTLRARHFRYKCVTLGLNPW